MKKLFIKKISVDNIDIEVIQGYLCASPVYSHDTFLCVLNEINNKFLLADVVKTIDLKEENSNVDIKSEGD
jgi:hypothetical protein